MIALEPPQIRQPTYYECSRGHLIRAIDPTRCAHCDGVISYSTPGFRVEKIVGPEIMLIDPIGRKHVMKIADVANGLLPGRDLPDFPGRWLYFMKTYSGHYQVGVSRNPYRLTHGEILDTKFFSSLAAANRAQDGIRANYPSLRVENPSANAYKTVTPIKPFERLP